MASAAEHLKGAGLAVTRQRTSLIEALQRASGPSSAENLARTLSGVANTTTVYRALDQLVGARLVRRIDLGRNHALYELADRHHHHLVCRSCGLVEDVTACVPGELPQAVLKESSRFAQVEDHALEFFGTCRSCKKTSSRAS